MFGLGVAQESWQLWEGEAPAELYQCYRQKIQDCDRQIEQALKQFPDHSQDKPSLQPKRTKRRPNSPSFDARSELYRLCGVDLTAIDGVDANTALKVIAEIGIDMSPWPTEKHFCSWLCLCPGTKKSGGKRLSSKTRPGGNRVAAALRMAAESLQHSASAMGAFYRRMKARLGAPAAITAAAHRLARVIYAILRHGQAYVDIGQQAHEQQFRQRMLKNLQRQARKLGLQVIAPPDPLGLVAGPAT